MMYNKNNVCLKGVGKMLKAIGSKVDLDNKELEYNHLVADLLENEIVLKMK